MKWQANAPVRGQRLRRKSPPTAGAVGRLFCRHQSFPGRAQSQLNSERRRQKQVYFSRLNFLKITGGDLRLFRQLVLGPTPADPLAPDVCAKDFDSLPFFFGNSHDILHRFSCQNVNDAYIVKKVSLLLKEKPDQCVLV
jgi:hypothetical protein